MKVKGNLGHHHPKTKITPYSLHERMAAYDRLPKVLRDAYKDLLIKRETVGTDKWLENTPGSVHLLPKLCDELKKSSEKQYRMAMLHCFGEVP